MYNAICSKLFPPFEHLFPCSDSFLDAELHCFQKPSGKPNMLKRQEQKHTEIFLVLPQQHMIIIMPWRQQIFIEKLLTKFKYNLLLILVPNIFNERH